MKDLFCRFFHLSSVPNLSTTITSSPPSLFSFHKKALPINPAPPVNIINDVLRLLNFLHKISHP